MDISYYFSINHFYPVPQIFSKISFLVPVYIKSDMASRCTVKATLIFTKFYRSIIITIMVFNNVVLPYLPSLLVCKSGVLTDRIRINEIAILSARICFFNVLYDQCNLSLNHISLNPFSTVYFLRSKKNLSIHFSFFLSFMYFKISFFTILAYFGYSHPNIAHP